MFVTEQWIDRFPASALEGLTWLVSDHCPLVLESQLPKEGPHPFRFENVDPPQEFERECPDLVG